MSPPSRTSLSPSTPSHPSRLSQSTGFEFPVSHYKFPLALCFTYGNVCVSMLLSICPCYCCKVASVVSDSVRPHRWQPTRLPCPWDSPGKNTGVGCHVLLQCLKVKNESEVAQLCPTLSYPMDCSLPGSSAHGIFQARALEWGAIALFNLV